eukprot:3547852-Amphidinium_carterae.1
MNLNMCRTSEHERQRMSWQGMSVGRGSRGRFRKMEKLVVPGAPVRPDVPEPAEPAPPDSAASVSR